jgi:hypothetical protein
MSQLREQTSEIRTTQRGSDLEQRIFSFKATQLIWLALGLLEGLIAMRVLLKLIGANADSLFASFIYGFSYLFLFPFEGLVGTPAAGGAVLEISSIIAMLVYALLFWAVERIVWVVFYRPRGPLVGVTQTTTSEPIAVTQTTTSEPIAVTQTTTREQSDV